MHQGVGGGFQFLCAFGNGECLPVILCRGDKGLAHHTFRRIALPLNSDDAMNRFKEIMHIIRRRATVDAPGVLDGFQVFLGPFDEEPGKSG